MPYPTNMTYEIELFDSCDLTQWVHIDQNGIYSPKKKFVICLQFGYIFQRVFMNSEYFYFSV